MHYDGTTYRPPMEANTTLLQVTVGCSYNKCAFCTMYRKKEFHMSPEEEIVEDLMKLRSAGYNDLYIGLETGYEPALKFITKGFTIAEAEQTLDRLLKAGFNYNALLMCGIAGKGNSEANAEATAKLLNTYKPKMVSLVSTAVSPGTPLADMRDRGEYVQLTEREIVEEELMLLQALDMDDNCFFHGSHPFNIIPIREYFAKKEDMILDIEMELMEYEPEFLDSIWDRGNI